MTHTYRHPDESRGAWLANRLANSRWLRSVRRWLLARLPFPVLQSDVRDVLYLSWPVPLHLAQSLSPPGVALVEHGTQAVFTILMYRHGHFGPRFSGRLRRLFPSPLQSNWRFYVAAINGTPTSEPTVLFVRNFFSSALYAVGTRVGSDALPSDLPSRFDWSTGEVFRSQLSDRTGELLLEVEAASSDAKRLPHAFCGIYACWEEAVAAITLQDTAVVQPPDLDALAMAGISLPIDPASVKPMDANVTCGSWLAQLGIEGRPLAFVVPSVRFLVLWEKIVARTCGSRAESS